VGLATLFVFTLRFNRITEPAPVLDYLARDDLLGFGALGPVSMLRAFANSVGRKFIKGHAFAKRL